MSVGRICQREVDLAEANESVRAAAQRMHQRNVGTLVVVGHGRRPVGIVTDRDIVTRVVASARNPDETRVADIMTAHPTSVTEETPIESALALMRSGEFRRVPVTIASGELAGVVSLDDILLLLAEEMAAVGELLASETPRSAAKTRSARTASGN
jgi:CBS domain-containing protein